MPGARSSVQPLVALISEPCEFAPPAFHPRVPRNICALFCCCLFEQNAICLFNYITAHTCKREKLNIKMHLYEMSSKEN